MAQPALASPLISSRSRDWREVRVALYRFPGFDAMVPMDEHLIGVHVSGTVQIAQSRGGRTRVTRLGPGDVTVTPRGDPKHFRHSGDNVVIAIRLSSDYVRQVAGDCAIDCARCEIVENDGARDDTLAGIGKRMLAALEPAEPAGRLRIDELKSELALHLLARYSNAANRGKRAAAVLSPRKLARAIEYMDSHLREDISLACLASALAMSPSHLSHAFRTATGLPPHRFLIQRRIERAKLLLSGTDLPITDIAHCIGCASHSHFSVLFHRETGQTPRQFRA